jgi:iron complex outermembrane receptor protein
MSCIRLCLSRVLRLSAAACLVTISCPAIAEALEEIRVIGVTPARAVGLPEHMIPYHVQSAGADDVERSQSLDLTDFLNRGLGSVSLNDAQNNPLQPDLQYRGFTASPLLGLAQGLAVYQNGIRINEPLGDAVHWDLLPESAIHRIDLIGGANPLFGLNTLGGALAVEMKNGFNTQGHGIRAYGGSFGRKVVTAESGGNNGTFGWYGNVHYFDEDGWRDLSESDALNFYGSLGWRTTLSELNLNFQHGESELTGNGASPVELLAVRRRAIFTAPDITENSMVMVSVDGRHALTDKVHIGGNAFYRRNRTKSFNGDASEFALCELGGRLRLLEGFEDDDVEELGIDDDDVCENQFADAEELEDFLNALARTLGEDEEFDIDDLTDDLSGTGILSDEAINNISRRTQESWGGDIQASFLHDLFNRGNQFTAGAAWFRGRAAFDAVVELAFLDPETRSTAGLGTGTFVDDEATDIETDTDIYSIYFTNTLELTDRLALTVSGRYNHTRIELADQSGERPELNGKHTFRRFNPAVGLTFQAADWVNLYGGYSESSRAPTPIELSCNEEIFTLAQRFAEEAGEDPDDVDFECRLPNAFLADPPLDQVVTRSFEIGARGRLNGIAWHLGFFHSVNHDDILFQTTGRATGLFANVDETRRMGFESSFRGTRGNVDWFLAYSYIEATFESAFDVLSPLHPSADDDGEVRVRAGSRIPGVPDHQLKLGADWQALPALTLGFDLVYNADQYLRGDESNELAPVDGYAVVNLRGRWRFNDRLEFFARINNVFDTNYETFGLLGEEPNEVGVPLFEDFRNPRFLGPGAPRSAFAGLKLSF